MPFKRQLSLDLRNKATQGEWACYSHFIGEESEPQSIGAIKLQQREWNLRLLICVLRVHVPTGVTSTGSEWGIRPTHQLAKVN